VTDSPVAENGELADAELAEWMAQVRRSTDPPLRETGAQAAREASARRVRPPGPELPLVTDLRTDGGLPLRLYRPALAPRPLVLYLHGGFFVLGSLESHDSVCRRLASLAGVAVLAVDYRLAPEHPAPAAVDDAVAAFGWAVARPGELGARPAAGIALAGDSAGGTIAALAAAAARDRGTPASALLLAYPNADMTLSSPSVRIEGDRWGPHPDDLRWSVRQWIPDPARRAEFSPVHADLAGLPPTMIATAECDPLRDEGFRLHERLREAGVPVSYVAHRGLVHGFLGQADISPAARRAGDELFTRFGQLVSSRLPARCRCAIQPLRSVDYLG
jgi:acetyl esterase